MEMFPSSKIFIKDDSDTSQYEMYLEDAKLSLTYYKLESNIRNSWYLLVDSQKLERVIPIDKIRHYTLQSGSSVSCEWESWCMFGLGKEKDKEIGRETDGDSRRQTEREREREREIERER